MVCFTGTVVELKEEGRLRRVLMEEEKKEEQVGTKGCYCFPCSEYSSDPIEALRSCPVEEVRAAFAKGGFDLKEFDERCVISIWTSSLVLLSSRSLIDLTLPFLSTVPSQATQVPIQSKSSSGT